MKNPRPTISPAQGRRLRLAKGAARLDVVFLRAGPVSLRFDPVWLWMRHFKCGEVEVLRGVYPAVRDRGWGTLQPAVSWLDRRIGPDHFHLEIEARYGGKSPGFVWRLTLDGCPDGTVIYSARGAALRPFATNRAGFCVLHPPGVAGKPCRIESVDGAVSRRRFPAAISPHQPFFNVRAMTHAPSSGTRVTVRMEGDVFETEDQRNWTDASFKTYCRPLALPFPYTLQPGVPVEQRVVIRVKGPFSRRAAARCCTLTPSSRQRRFPSLGLVHSGRSRLTAQDAGLLRTAGVRHLRIDLDLESDAWRRQWQAAEADIGRIGGSVGLEVALHAEPRLREPFGAAWTVASIAALAHAGTDSATYHGTTGDDGILPRRGAPPPVFDAFVSIASFRADSVVEITSSHPGEACGLMLRSATGSRILLVNLRPVPQPVRVGNLPGPPARVALLGGSASQRRPRAPASIDHRRAKFELPGYGILQLDFPDLA